MDVYETLTQIAGAVEVAKVDRYEIVRPTRPQSQFQLQQHSITIDIADYGPGSGENRFVATARSSDSKPDLSSTGNPAATVDDALRNVHWNEFD